jgi:hypothetical protein
VRWRWRRQRRWTGSTPSAAQHGRTNARLSDQRWLHAALICLLRKPSRTMQEGCTKTAWLGRSHYFEVAGYSVQHLVMLLLFT